MTYSEWPWARSLALAESGDPVQIERILFGTVRDYCEYLGIREGSVVTCTDRDGDTVKIQLPEGRTARVSREYAWFVLVQRAG